VISDGAFAAGQALLFLVAFGGRVGDHIVTTSEGVLGWLVSLGRRVEGWLVSLGRRIEGTWQRQVARQDHCWVGVVKWSTQTDLEKHRLKASVN